MKTELVQKMHMMDANPAETEFLNDGPDFHNNEMYTRYTCQECKYYVCGKDDSPPKAIKYCPNCGRKVKWDEGQ